MCCYRFFKMPHYFRGDAGLIKVNPLARKGYKLCAIVNHAAKDIAVTLSVWAPTVSKYMVRIDMQIN
jgi:hypothetical protein